MYVLEYLVRAVYLYIHVVFFITVELNTKKDAGLLISFFIR